MFKINLFRVLSYCITSYTDTVPVLDALVKNHAKHQKQSNHKKHPRQLNEVHLHYLNLPMQSKPEKKKQRKKPSNKASQQKQQKHQGLGVKPFQPPQDAQHGDVSSG